MRPVDQQEESIMDKNVRKLLYLRILICITVSALMLIRARFNPSRAYHFEWAFFVSTVIYYARDIILSLVEKLLNFLERIRHA